MIEIECRDINTTLCKECDDILQTVSKSILQKHGERASGVAKEF